MLEVAAPFLCHFLEAHSLGFALRPLLTTAAASLALTRCEGAAGALRYSGPEEHIKRDGAAMDGYAVTPRAV